MGESIDSSMNEMLRNAVATMAGSQSNEEDKIGVLYYIDRQVRGSFRDIYHAYADDLKSTVF